MDSGSRCPIHLTASLGNVVNRAAAPEGQMPYDSTQGNFHFNDSTLSFVWEAWSNLRSGRPNIGPRRSDLRSGSLEAGRPDLRFDFERPDLSS